jgi:hypothetical protein
LGISLIASVSSSITVVKLIEIVIYAKHINTVLHVCVQYILLVLSGKINKIFRNIQKKYSNNGGRSTGTSHNK